MSSWPRTSFLLLLMVPGLISCTTIQPPGLISQRSEIQQRVHDHFENVVLFKPAASGLHLPLAAQLAPLVVQEIPDDEEVLIWQDQFTPTDGTPQVDYTEGVVLLNDRWYRQFTYWWRYASASARPEPGAFVQGIRITLNTDDEPVIWEVLTESLPVNIIYVARSVESGTQQEFGPPLSGRAFSVEGSSSTNPDVVVANIVQDGPLPMGPIVYLGHGTRDVIALICRCMPSQFERLRGQKDYRLNPADAEPTVFKQVVDLASILRLPAEL